MYTDDYIKTLEIEVSHLRDRMQWYELKVEQLEVENSRLKSLLKSEEEYE